MTQQKAIIFDASTLITFSMNGLIDEFRKLKAIFDGHFIITQDVKREVIDKPITIKKFELEALRIKKLLSEGVLEMPSVFGINEKKLADETQKIKQTANSTFNARGRDLHLIDSGESSCLVLGKILTEKEIKCTLAVDERTTRMLCEKPENLKALLEEKLHTKVEIKKNNLSHFKGFTFIRSAELIYVAYKRGLVDIKDGNSVLDALLYAVKFKGCAISGAEIEEIKKMK